MRSLVVLVVVAGCLVAAACKKEAPPAPASTVPTAPPAEAALTDEDRTEAQALVTTACVGCHTFEMLEQQRLTRKQWENTVKKMQGWGAPMDPAQLTKAARYLAERFGPQAGPWAPPPVDPVQALADLEPLPDGALAGGDAAAGAAVYGRSCAPCHGADGAGTPIGVNVVDRPVVTRAADFAALIRAGRGRMPALPLPDGDIAAVLAHVRTLE